MTALKPVLNLRGGVWVGWAGTDSAETEELKAHLAKSTQDVGYTFEPVVLSSDEVEGFYRGFSNEIVWPLFHDLLGRCRFDPDHWRSYVSANRKYAEAIAGVARDGDLVWVHDYHLMGVATHLRASGLTNRLGFFLHIPFPQPDMFLRLPWRSSVLEELLDYDLVAFQTPRDCRHFLQCLCALYSVKSLGTAPRQEYEVCDRSGGRTRRLQLGIFPISIDYREFAEQAAQDETAARVAELEKTTNGRRIILSVDRLDYTKGILAKLEGFRTAVRRNSKLIDHVVLHLQVVPSRERIPDYRRLRLQVERTVSEINGEFSRPGSIPVHYYYQTVPRDELVARYRAADVMLVTPFKDGMNLVAKEYCSCQTDDAGVLVLSEFAGAAAELKRGALLVNPHDVEGMAAKIQQAVDLPAEERRKRMRTLKQVIRQHDVFHWATSYLERLEESGGAPDSADETLDDGGTPRASAF